MSEDVFRIFRQTGRRISLIKQQVERERCCYLKDSYTEKNQLYKELAGIFQSKRAMNEKSRQLQGVGESQSGSRVGATAEGASGGHERHLSAHKALKGMRSINVSVLKRCECCRRRAFRAVDDDDDDDGVFDEEAFHGQCESESRDDKLPDKEKTKATRKTSQVTRAVENKKAKRQKARVVQFSRYDDVRIPATQRVQAGIWALKKQTNGRKQTNQKKSVTFQKTDSTTSLCHEEEKVASSSETKRALESATPGVSSLASTRPTLKSRASIKLEYQTSKSNERVRLEGTAWTSHVENVQEKKLNNTSKGLGLSKAYCAFKKFLRQIEEENTPEQLIPGDECRVESPSELPGSRPSSNLSRTDSRWVPLRRSPDTLSVRLNSWTAGSLEPACMDSFEESGTEED